jgi:hypothetical protein
MSPLATAGPHGEHLELLEVTAYSPSATGAGTVTVIRANEPDPEPVDCPVAGPFTPTVGGKVWVETGSGSWVAVAPEGAGGGAATAYAVRLRKPGAGSAVSGTPTAVTFSDASVVYDFGGLYSEAVHADRIIFPVAGVYGVGCHGRWAANPTGTRTMEIVRGGSGGTRTIGRHGFAVYGTGVVEHPPMATEDYFEVGDWVIMQVTQTSGAGLALASDVEWSPVFWASRRG